MPRQPRSADEIVIAKSIFDEIIGETEKDDFGKDKAQAARSAKQEGGKKGGSARAKTLTPKRRKEIAQKAAAARWKNSTT